MLKVSTPQPILGPRDAAAPYQIKTRQTTRAARGKPKPVSYYESGSDADSDAGSAQTHRKRKAKKAMKPKLEVKPILAEPVAPRPEPEAQANVWVEDEISQWHAYILSRLDEHNARHRQCLHKGKRWPAPREVSALAHADDAESRTFVGEVPHEIAPLEEMAAHGNHAQPEQLQQHAPLPVRRRGAPISDLLLSPDHMVSSWQQAPGSRARAGHSAQALPHPQTERLFETLSQPFYPPLHPHPALSSPAPPAAPAPVWLYSEPEESDHHAPRSVSSASSSSQTLLPPSPVPVPQHQQKDRVAKCWACTTMGESFCKVHRQ